MRSNISSARLNDYVQVVHESDETDDYGQPLGDVLLFDARANVDVKAGSKLQEYGTTLTSTIITCLMWRDIRLMSGHKLLWNGGTYYIDHVQPDEMNKAMIVTCTKFEER